MANNCVSEQHFTISELAKSWRLSYSTVLRMFMDEPGVLKSGARVSRRRTRVCLRIPASVAEDVYKRRTR